MATYYGIDLGTTQCLAAQYRRNPFTDEEELTCLMDPETGEFELPSVVSFLSKDNYITGTKAMRRLYQDPESSVELVKVRLGKTDSISVRIPDGGTIEKSPQEIASLLLRSLKETRQAPIRSALLTVPAFFNQSQREATIQAGRMAEFDTEDQAMIEEPTAAIIYQIYAEYRQDQDNFLKKLKKGENVLVFDFGGGTLDLSAIRISCDEDAVQSEVLAHEGDPDLGGNIIDFLLTENILARLKAKYPKDEDVLAVVEAFQPYLDQYLNQHVLRFQPNVSDHIKQMIFITKRTAEECKIALSEQDSVMVRTPFTRCEPFRMTRDEFNNFILNHELLNLRERIKNTLNRIARKLKDNNIKLSRVLLVGGSSQIPYVREIIRNAITNLSFSEDKIVISADCMRAVALGAAIQQTLRKGEAVLPFRHNYCKNIVSRDIMIGCGKTQIKRFVESGKPYPFPQDEEASILIPHALSENVSFALYECIRDGDEERTVLISTYEYYLPLYYTGEEIRVHLNIGDDGLYKVSATYTPTQDTVFFDTYKEHILTDEQMKQGETRVQNMKLVR